MSTLKVTNIESPSGGGVNAKITDINGGQLSNRNLIINGSMQVSQRTTSTTAATSGGAYGLDRWEAFASGGGAYTQEQSTTVPDNTFKNSAKLTVTTADSSIAAADYYAFNYNIEGNDIIRTGYGTSDAVSMTLSFWARSSVGGKYSVTVYNHNGSRGYLNTFDLVADTWKHVTISFAGDTGGTWNKDNSKGLVIRFDLGGGSNGNGTANQWTTSGSFAANHTSDSVKWISTNAATFYLTGVQFEVGSVATAFEHRSFGDELARCQRYYYMIADGNSKSIVSGAIYATNNFYSVFTFPVVMRAAPTLDSSSGSNYFDLLSDGVSDNFNAVLLGNSSTTAAELRAHSSEGLSGATAGHAAWMRTNNSAAHIALTAEP